jgi:FAD:protein FMN transferase
MNPAARYPRLLATAAIAGAAIASTATMLVSCAPRKTSDIVKSEFVLGTACTIRVAHGGSAALLDEAYARLHRLEAEISATVPTSEISRANAEAGLRPVAIGPDARAIIARDLVYARASRGAFDPSVGPLVKLWAIGFGREKGSEADLPAAMDIEKARGLVGWNDVVLDEGAGTVFLRRKGMALDLGSGTKGYAADRVVEILARGGADSAVIDLGGNIFVMGAKPDGKPWRVGLQNPEGSRGSYIGIATLVNKTMVTSGVYERFFFHEGKRYHHILNTRSGYPVENGLVSVTIIAAKSFDADGLTTMLFALGLEQGMDYAKRNGVDVIMIDDRRRVYLSPGVSAYFEITDSSYAYAELPGPKS